LNSGIVIGSAAVGLLVGLTGAGGGALMTPMLILLFSVKPSAAISSDLVAALVMRPVGAAVHFQRRTVNMRLVALLSAGSVPAAFAGAYLLHVLGGNAHAGLVERTLGAALLAGAAAMVLRAVIDRRSAFARAGDLQSVTLRPGPTVAVGALGGVVVGLTSVGAGSLMVVLLMFAYPTLAARRLVGTDLTQAVPLSAAAALGALMFGPVQAPLTAAIVVGSVPAVLVGSLLSSRISDRHLRPAIFVVVLASGLKYVGMPARLLGAAAGALAVIGLAVAAWRRMAGARRSVGPAEEGSSSSALSRTPHTTPRSAGA
jgi:uncharacterized membrane protein YfcA